MSDIDLKSRYDIGWFSAYDTLKGMVILYGVDKVKEAIAEIEGNLTMRALDGAKCALCGMPRESHDDYAGKHLFVEPPRN